MKAKLQQLSVALEWKTFMKSFTAIETFVQ